MAASAHLAARKSIDTTFDIQIGTGYCLCNYNAIVNRDSGWGFDLCSGALTKLVEWKRTHGATDSWDMVLGGFDPEMMLHCQYFTPSGFSNCMILNKIC